MNEDELKAWLDTQPQEVRVAIAYRMAMRILPFYGKLPLGSRSRHMLKMYLMSFRAVLTTAVAAERPTSQIHVAASMAASAVRASRSVARAGHDDLRSGGSDDASNDAARIVGNVCDVVADPVRAFEAALFTLKYAFRRSAEYFLGTEAAGETAAMDAVYLDATMNPKLLTSSRINLPEVIRETHEKAEAAGGSILHQGGPWTFWAKWYARAMEGDPLPWGLQEQIALIPDEVWEAEPEAVAERIQEIEDEYWAAKLPQAEQLVEVANGRFDILPDPNPIDQTLENILNRVEFAIHLPIQSNCGFNEMCTAYKYLEHTLRNCRNDPNAVEQHFQQARKIIRKKLIEGEHQSNDALDALVDGLEQHALQIRGTFPEVREAHAKRVEQKIRETDDKVMLMVAGVCDPFRKKRRPGACSMIRVWMLRPSNKIAAWKQKPLLFKGLAVGRRKSM